MFANVTKTFRFEAAHQLLAFPDGHKCKSLHGHSYSVSVTVDVNILHQLGDRPRTRLPEHQPEHNPLADCRHSLRQFEAVLAKL